MLYALDEHYGWGQGMREITLALLANRITAEHKILELGCGSGNQLRALQQHARPSLAIGMDRHPLALAYAAQPQGGIDATMSGNVQFVQSDLHHLPFSDSSFDVVIGLDVFDQIGVQLAWALTESHRVLQREGFLMLRVSAYSWLMSGHDRAFNTGQRFNTMPLVNAVTDAGFAVVRSSHANTLFAPPVIMLRLLERWLGWSYQRKLYTNSFSNRLLVNALREEARWLRHFNLPFGISLYLLAKKI